MKKPRVNNGSILSLSRETLRQLATRQLDQIVAGTDGATGDSNNGCESDICHIRRPIQ